MDKRTGHRLASAALVAFVAVGAAGCGKRGDGDNANNNNANRAATNSNFGTTTNTAAPVQSDTALGNTVKANLTKAGISGVEVEVVDGVVTLKGSVPRAKLSDAVKAANDAGPKRVLNQLSAQ